MGWMVLPSAPLHSSKRRQRDYLFGVAVSDNRCRPIRNLWGKVNAKRVGEEET
jgi:hypothetical protein